MILDRMGQCHRGLCRLLTGRLAANALSTAEARAEVRALPAEDDRRETRNVSCRTPISTRQSSARLSLLSLNAYGGGDDLFDRADMGASHVLTILQTRPA
jgi:hypothetical protein